MIDRLARERALLANASAALAAAIVSLAIVRDQESKALVAVLAVSGLALCLARPRTFILAVLPFALLTPPTVVLHAGRLPDQTPLRSLVLACSFAVAGAAARGDGFRGIRLPRYVTVAFAVYAGAVVTLAATHVSVPALREAFAVTTGLAAPAVLSLWAVRTESDVWRAVRCIVAAADIAVALALVEEVRGRYLISAATGIFFHPDDRAGWLRAQAVFPHPIVFGSFLAIALPLALGWWLQAEGRARVVAGSSAVVICVGLVLSLSRGPWLAALAGALVVGVSAHRATLRVAGAAAITGVLLVVSPLGAPAAGAFSELVHPSSSHDAYSMAYRKQLADEIFGYGIAHPFSAHLDLNDQVQLPADVVGRSVDLSASVDNSYAYYVLKLGLVGAALLVAVLLAAAIATRQVVRRGAGSTRSLGAALCGAQVSVIVVSATVASLSWLQIGVLYSFVAGLGLSLFARSRGRS